MARKIKRRRDGISYRAWDESWYSSVTGKKEPLRDEHGQKIRGRDREAEAKAAYHLAAAAVTSPGPHAVTIGTIVTRYLEKLVAQGAAPETIDHYTPILEDFLSSVGRDRPASKLRHEDLDRWIAAHTAWSPSTIAGRVRVVKAALNHAVKKTKLIQESFAFGYETPRIEARTEVLLSEQLGVLLEQCSPDARQILWMLHETGARPGELVATEAGHFHDGPRHGQIVLPWTLHKTGRKTHKSRVIALSQEATILVRRLAALHPSGPIFRSYYACRGGRRWTAEQLAGRFRRAKQKANKRLSAGLKIRETISPYTLRHTFATRKIDAGVPIERVASWLGNTVAMVQKHYWHAFHRANVNLYVGLDEEKEATCPPAIASEVPVAPAA